MGCNNEPSNQVVLPAGIPRIGFGEPVGNGVPAALDNYKAAYAIFDRLAKADPGNADWQRELALSLGGVGMVEARQGLRDSALKTLRQGRDIIAQLESQAPYSATLPKILAWFDGQIRALDG